MLLATERILMTRIITRSESRIARRAVDQGARSAALPLAMAQRSKNLLQRQELQLLKPKKEILISTFNVQTLNHPHKAPELVHSAIQNNIDVICIQEHRFHHPDLELKHTDVGKGWTVISASAWKNSQNATIGGVGILLSPKALKSLQNIEKITPRIVVATFNGNPATTVISCYSPTNISEESDVLLFYEKLSALTRHVPKHNLLIVAGDMNAQMDGKFSYHNSKNRNGNHLADYLEENNLLCLNTHYQKRPSKLWTHTYPNRSHGQLDYIFINKKWKNSALNCEAYKTFDSVGSDHKIVSAKIRLSLRANKIKSSKSPQNLY